MCVTLCVTGCFILVALAELHVQPLNHSVIFMKERDVVLSNDQWRVAVNVNLSTYYEILSTVKSDLLAVEQQRKEFTATSELKEIELFVQILEDKLHDFYQILPRPDPRRGLLNLGGNILKTIFGTTTVSDVHELHGVLDDLQNRNSDIVHSLTNQLTYIKKVADTASLNTESIANLSSIVKDSIIQSHDKYQQFTRDLLWLNFTFLGQSTIYTAVRQMEFTLLQLTQQLDEIFDAIQLEISGNLSMKLISPSSLQSILRNITLHLPEGYELIAGTRTEDIHQYYKLSKVSIVANSHSLKLVLLTPLKSADHSFTLYKIITLPERISSDKFVQYAVDYPYLAVQVSQPGYIPFTERDYSRCVSSSNTACPLDSAIFNKQSLTCAASLFFQSPNRQHLCKRNLLLNHRQSTMIQHRNVWIYYFPTPRQLTVRCPGNEASPPGTQVLVDAGLLINASACHVSTEDWRIYPTLRGTMQTERDTPHIFTPDKVPIISPHESQLLQEMTIPTLQRLDNLNSRLATSRHTIDIDSLIHVHQSSQGSQMEVRWHTIALILSFIIVLLGVGYLLLRSHCGKLRCAATKTPDNESATSSPQHCTPEPHPRNTEQNVVFSTYSVQHAS